MKKQFLVTAAAVALTVSMFTGCTSTPETEPTPTPSASPTLTTGFEEPTPAPEVAALPENTLEQAATDISVLSTIPDYKEGSTLNTAEPFAIIPTGNPDEKGKWAVIVENPKIALVYNSLKDPTLGAGTWMTSQIVPQTAGETKVTLIDVESDKKINFILQVPQT